MARALNTQLILFSGVGVVAALVHVLTVINLVSLFHMQPLAANIIAFLIAFNVSYLGHKYVTFSRHEEKELNLPRFFIVASSAGILNELLYFLILNYTSLPYFIALVPVLGLVAIYTFILSRFWACC